MTQDQWIAWLVGPVPPFLAKDHVPSLMFAFGTQVFKYLVFNKPDWDYSTYDFSNFESDTRLAASFLNATSPDLDAFKARKGKLILWHGWANPALPPEATAQYYRQVQPATRMPPITAGSSWFPAVSTAAEVPARPRWIGFQSSWIGSSTARRPTASSPPRATMGKSS